MMGLIVFDKLLNRKDNITPIGLTRKSSLKNLDILTFTIDNSNKLEKYDRVLVKDLKLKWKEFVVTSIDCVHNNDATSQIYCEDAMGELRNYFITEKRSRDESCYRALEKVLEGTGWDFETDSTVTGLGTTSYYRISVLEALDKISETWGVEIDSEIEINQNGISKRLIKVSKKLGDDTGKRFSFGKDILSITRTVDESEVITALYGFGASLQIENESEDDKESGYTRKIDFSEINNGKAYVENLTAKNEYGIRGVDGTIYHRFGRVSFDNIEDKVELKRLTEEKLVELSKPTITYETTVADLSVAGYILEGVGKGDTVKIRDKDLNLALEARVLELTHKYDENEIEITLGTYKNLYGSDIMSVSEIVRRLADKENIYDRSRFFNEDGTNFSKFETILEDINNRFESGTTNITFDENGGITFTDKSTDEESSWAMNLSSYGLRIANTKHANGTWNWRTAATGDGFYADEMFAGFISADLIRTGILASRNNITWLDLDNGSFSFANNRLTYSSAEDLKLNGQLTSSQLDRQAIINYGQYRIFKNNQEILNISNFVGDGTDAYITLGQYGRKLKIGKSLTEGKVDYNFMTFDSTDKSIYIHENVHFYKSINGLEIIKFSGGDIGFGYPNGYKLTIGPSAVRVINSSNTIVQEWS